MPAPSSYNEKYHDRWAWSLALKGATDEDIADAFGISVRTLHRWKKEHESFAEALGPGKDVADAQVKHSLYQRAIGYDAKDVEQIIVTDPATGGKEWKRPVWSRSISHPIRWRVCTGSTTGARESSLSVRKSLWEAL